VSYTHDLDSRHPVPRTDAEILRDQRQRKIAELETLGMLDPACPGCAEDYAFYRTTWRVGLFPPMHPNHKPSDRCESGKRPHCSCDTCF
jgi:hypothetical protein